MRYLMDTCVVSELVKRNPNPSVTRWVNSTDEESLFLSVLTIGEIQKGISKLSDLRRKTELQSWLDGELKVRFGDRLLAVNEETATLWGEITGTCELRAAPLPAIDGLICATALVNRMTIVTRNESDFVESGVNILNPWMLCGP